jgi:hypothetical protein
VGLGLLVRFRNNIFLRGGVVNLTPNPQPGGPGYPFLSGSSPLTCLAWETLPLAYATASIALGIMWTHKPRHYTKVGIPSGGIYIYIYIPPSLTFKAFRSAHTMYSCMDLITAIISLCSINWVVCVAEMECVLRSHPLKYGSGEFWSSMAVSWFRRLVTSQRAHANIINTSRLMLHGCLLSETAECVSTVQCTVWAHRLWVGSAKLRNVYC